jgi:hypothetical protein
VLMPISSTKTIGSRMIRRFMTDLVSIDAAESS